MNVKNDKPSNLSIKEDKDLCPLCEVAIKITKNMNYDIIDNNIKNDEFIKLSCKKCNTEFCYILCVYCQKKIYMKINQKISKYNGIKGFNIKCPYKFCENIFYFTECIKCERIQKVKKQILEGNTIICEYKDCQFKYMEYNCPEKYCPDLFLIENPKINKNYPYGLMSIHKKEINVMHQKINCVYCLRPIVFASKAGKRNKYIECQKVICPYDNCKKAFNRIICPFCFDEIIVNNGWYEMGSEIKCQSCKKSFGKILCYSCKLINICQNNFFKFGKMTCGIINCLKQNYMINCIYCKRLNVFDKKIPIHAQAIKCGYCKNIFNKLCCPFCELINSFPFGDFSFGKVYSCKYLNCLKIFQLLICPNCLSYSYKGEKKEGNKYKCHKCNLLFMNWRCPFCKSTTMSKNCTLQIGELVQCPSKECGKIYSFIKCFKCQKLIFSNENQTFFGISIKCPYPNCDSNFLLSQCTNCGVKTTYINKKDNYYEGQIINCPNCKKDYKFKRKNNIYKNDLSILEYIEGSTIDFGVGEIDQNYMFKQSLFFDKAFYPSQLPSSNESQITSFNEEIENDENKPLELKNLPLNECIICCNRLKQSIFYPCGHRCACYICAEISFNINKKCPRCGKEAKCIIKQII